MVHLVDVLVQKRVMEESVEKRVVYLVSRSYAHILGATIS